MLHKIIGDRYEILAELGNGGSGTVYLAEKIQTNQRYAIKIISTEEKNAIKLLDRETQTLKRLKHPNIVKFFESGYDNRNELVYLVLEYLKGRDILDYFDSGVELKTKAKLFNQILDAISYAHSKDVIHRDIKPENIRVINDGEQPVAKVLDFGIAIITTTILTNTIRSYHTPLFSPPEQINLEGVSRDSDIYSLGMTFLYLLSDSDSRYNFRDTRNKDVLYASVAKHISYDSGEKEQLLQVLKQATDKTRGNRPKIDEIRKVISCLSESLEDSLPVIFTLTKKFSERISENNNFQNQDWKIKEYIESSFNQSEGNVYISKDRQQNNKDTIAVLVGIERISTIYKGFVDLKKRNKVVLYNNLNFTPSNFFENSIEFKIEPIININSFLDRGCDLSNIIEDIEQQEQKINNEKESEQRVYHSFKNWEKVIELEEEIVNHRKQKFSYSDIQHDFNNQILVITLNSLIDIEVFDDITSPPLPVTISMKNPKPPYQDKQWSVGDIIHGTKSQDGEKIAQLHISLKDSFDLSIIEFISKSGVIETDFRAQESEINRRKKALRAIKYSDSKNSRLSQVIANPNQAQRIEPIPIHDFFNRQLDEPQQKAVSKALACEDIFLIQGPPGTGKTSVITEIILQILAKYPQDKILISSQSNIAVDNVLSKLSTVTLKGQNINCIRIGREEKIEPDARQFEIEQAIMKWQRNISQKSKECWEEEYKENWHDLLLSKDKISCLNSIKNSEIKYTSLVNQINQYSSNLEKDLFLSTSQNTERKYSDRLIELVYEKYSLEDKIIINIQKYVEQFSISFPEKRKFTEWLNEEKETIKSIIGAKQENYENFLELEKLYLEWNKRLKKKQPDLFSIFLDNVNVVGATCLGIANMRECDFDWVIIDEAGRSTGSETFVPMCRGQKNILVGDHKQLPPIIDRELQNRAFNEQEIQKRALEASLFEYLYNELPLSNKIILNNQYRMNPDIGNLVSYLFYDNEVSSDGIKHADKAHNLKSFSKNIYWISTENVKPKNKAYEKRNGSSYRNTYEAQLINNILLKIQKDCQAENIKKEIGVISAYSSQISVLESSITPNDKGKWSNLQSKSNSNAIVL